VPIIRNLPLSKRKVHLHHSHGLKAPETDIATVLYCFSLVICRHPITHKYLLCQEFANQGFWVPGGRVDEGEKPTAAAIRETVEEAGVEVDLKGVISIEYGTRASTERRGAMVKMRIIFYAEPKSTSLDKFPKCIPDYESAGACWCSYEDIWSGMRLRGDEPRIFSKYLEEGGTIYPLSILNEH
jgi:8-oxo-dGTP pyrophosphatase MutT (NUDIX family)